MSGMSFEWTQRNAERINGILDLVRQDNCRSDEVAILTFLALLSRSDQDFALVSYPEAGEGDRVITEGAEFLDRAGII